MKALISFLILLISQISAADAPQTVMRCQANGLHMDIVKKGGKPHFKINYFLPVGGNAQYPKELPVRNHPYLWEVEVSRLDKTTVEVRTPYVDGSNAGEDEIIQFRLQIKSSGPQRTYSLIGQWRENYFNFKSINCKN